MYHLIGLFGGLFDPFHRGHWQVTSELLTTLPFDRIQIIPCATPPHRPVAQASAEDRFHMIQKAINDHSRLTVDPIEINQQGPSYTVDTVRQLSSICPTNCALAFILAVDSFQYFTQWHDYTAILRYCHLIVVNRPNSVFTPDQPLKDLLAKHQTFSPDALWQKKAGKIFFQCINALPISSTQIRQKIALGQLPTEELLPATLHYIQEHHLYQATNSPQT